MNDYIKIYDKRNRLKTFLMALSALLISLLAILAFSSCVYDDYEPSTEAFKGDTFINLSVITSGTAENHEASAKGTRTKDDENPANPTSESNIHSIRVWVFDSESTNDNAIAIGYRKEILPQPVNGESEMHSVSIQLLRNAIKQDNQHLDLYVLANAESIGTTSLNGKDISFTDGMDEKTLTRQQLKELVIKSQFGITDEGKPQIQAVPSTGLPLSRVITRISVSNHVADTEMGAAAKAITVPLVRAVSKLHFFFARKANASTENIEVTKIEINEQTLPLESRVFPTEAVEGTTESEGLIGYIPNDAPYIEKKMLLNGVSNSNIREVANPGSLKRGDNETAANYMKRLYSATNECNLSYLRESNKPLSGTIFYKLNDSSEEKKATFNIPLSYRNTEMVVYGYFLDGGTAEVKLKYFVTAWNEKEETNIDFN